MERELGLLSSGLCRDAFLNTLKQQRWAICKMSILEIWYAVVRGEGMGKIRGVATDKVSLKLRRPALYSTFSYA